MKTNTVARDGGELREGTKRDRGRVGCGQGGEGREKWVRTPTLGFPTDHETKKRHTHATYCSI